jgi:hypothetical protein
MQDPSQARWRQFETNLFKRVARGKNEAKHRTEHPDHRGISGGAGLNSRFFVLTVKFRSALYRWVYGETNDKKRAK